MSQDLIDGALAFHCVSKLTIRTTKLLAKQRDFELAYLLGVVYACEEIVEDVAEAFKYNASVNLVAMNGDNPVVLGLSSADIMLDGSANERGGFDMTAATLFEAQSRFLEHDITPALDAQAG